MSDPMLELVVRITDGSYESKITMPTDVTDESRMKFIAAWMNLQKEGLAILKQAKG